MRLAPGRSRRRLFGSLMPLLVVAVAAVPTGCSLSRRKDFDPERSTAAPRASTVPTRTRW